MTHRLLRLAARRAGTTDWVEIDPSTPEGQRALSLLRITTTHPEEENDTMTTTATRTEHAARPAHLSSVPAAEHLGLIAQIKAFAGRIYNRVTGTVRGAWNWVRETFHLDAVTSRVSNGYRWAKDKVATGARFLGRPGMAGLGMLTISTSTGRKVLRQVFRPIGWVLKMIGEGYVWVEETLSNDGNGGIRNWISNRMADGREFLFGNAGKTGVIPAAALWTITHTGRHLLVDSFVMRSLRAVGTFLLGMRGVALLALLPLGGFAPVAAFAGTSLVFAGTAAPFRREFDAVVGRAKAAFKTNAAKADVIVEGTITEIKDEVTTAASLITTPANRAERRGHPAKKTTSARR